jgi:signal transduction histidine kinase
MSRSRILTVWAVAVLGLMIVAGSLVFILLGHPVPAYPAWSAITAYAVPLLFIGAVIQTARPAERLGRLILAQGLAASVMLVTGQYATFSVLGRGGRLPLTGASAWVSSVVQAALVVSLLLLVLWFPTGRLVSRRWRVVWWLVAASFALGVGTAAFGGPNFNSNIDFIRNPLAITPPRALRMFVDAVGTTVVPAALLGVLAHLVVRYRRSAGEEREQLKWFLSASVFAPLIIFVPQLAFPNAANGVVGNVTWTIGPLTVILAVGLAILRYRLYDIDVVINKALVYGLLAAFITAVYVAIVVGIGTLVGRGAHPNIALSIVATAVVAVAFQPVRERFQHLANRMVYGRRATPYEALSQFADRAAGTYATEDLLPRMARILAEGTGAARAAIWLVVGGMLRPGASWPAESGELPPVPMPGGELPSVPDASLVLPVRHRGELLGALSVTKPPGDRITPAETKLTEDLAAQAGLVLRNVRLIADVRASRVRLVKAQDEERRRLERNIHDGAQQQLVALAVKLGLARTLAGRDVEKADVILAQLQSDAQDALENLRDLARGIYPPLLADQGLGPALGAQARRSSVPVAVQADGIGRYPQEAEAAVYFSVLEALQNVAKYAAATSATVRLRADDAGLTFEVTDDGSGFDPSKTGYGTGLRGIGDRLDALGGTLEVVSAPGAGTTVRGRVPVVEIAHEDRARGLDLVEAVP